MEYREFSAKTKEDAITEACQYFTVSSDKLMIEVVDEGSNGFLGIGAKPAIIKAAVKGTVEDKAKDFLKDVLEAMDLEVVIDVKYDEAEKNMEIELKGDDMGVLIGKRGQTLDSLQYLVSLVVNKESEEYIRVKVDTEDYRKRRKRAVSLEPMNPYERRTIHSALQNDKYVTTHSEGDEPFRHVVVTLKKSERYERNDRPNRNR